MAGGESRFAWKVTSTVATLVAVGAAQKGTVAGWRWFTGDEPPYRPLRAGTPLGEAATWAALSGAAVGLGRLVAVRFTARQWVKATGAVPGGAEDIEVRAQWHGWKRI